MKKADKQEPGETTQRCGGLEERRTRPHTEGSGWLQTQANLDTGGSNEGTPLRKGVIGCV